MSTYSKYQSFVIRDSQGFNVIDGGRYSEYPSIVIRDSQGNIVDDFGGGGGGTGTLLVSTQSDLATITDPVEGQLVAVVETNTFWKYEGGVWVDTTTPYTNFYGGQVAETYVEVPYQRYKSNSELISLFGVVSDSLISVDQSAVIYDLHGTYNVVFNFSRGRSITVRLKIVEQFTFNLTSLRKYTKTLNNPLNFISQYPLLLDFSQYTLRLNGASTPTSSGDKYEWIKKPLSDLDKVTIDFNSVATLSDGKLLNCKVTFVSKNLYPYISTNQKWGFDIQDGILILKQAGFTSLEAKFQFSNEDGDIVYLNIATRVDNVHYAKMVGSESETTEFFVSPDTLLLGNSYYPSATEPSLFAAYRFEGDGDVLGADNIALGIVKQDTSSFTISFGKPYTGSVDFDYSTDNYLDLPFTMRVSELVSVSDLNDLSDRVDAIESVSREPQRMYENNATVEVPSNTYVTLLSVPKSEFTVGKAYNIDSEVKGTIATQGTYVFRVIYKSVDNLTTVLIPEQQKNYDNVSDVFLSPPNIIRPWILNDGTGGTVEFQMRKNTSSGTGATIFNTSVNIYNK